VNRLLLAGAAAGVALTTSVLPAHANHARYEGRCHFQTISDPITSPPTGGPTRYNGVVYVAVVVTDESGAPVPSSTISIDCELWVNGVFRDVALSASGVGAAAAAGTLSFEIEPWDVVDMCERTVIDGEEDFRCLIIEDPPPFDPAGIIETLVDTANELFFEPVVDPVVCPVFGSLAPGVPGVLDITPEGDAALPYEGGRFWDCPPYGE
jgi:hypothetical protein